MAFKFMEVYGQTPENDDQPISIMKVFTEIISKLIVGKTISFDTDDCGHITQFNNLDDIKAEIDSMLPVDLGKILNTPALSVLKDNDLDFSESDLTIANILIDSYVEDIQLMFIRYGTIYNIGEFHVHEDATETDYEHDTYASAVLDPSDGMIVLTTEVIHTIPGEDLREMVDGLIDIPDDEAMVESYNREMEALKGCDWVMDSYLRTSFLPESWPLGVLREKIVKIGEKGKIKRTYILFEGLE
ncbi:MAG: hypothetical protein K2M19_09435 [Muribaculaceae bacterium]|nr:hypothetical protein [Muribaculaceae bacterium]